MEPSLRKRLLPNLRRPVDPDRAFKGRFNEFGVVVKQSEGAVW